MKNVVTKSLFVLALMTISFFANSQEAMLKYSFVKGKTYAITTQLTNNITQSMGGQEMKQLSDMNSNSEMKIEDVDKDGNATSLFTLLNTSIHFSAMGRDTTMKFNDQNEQKRVVFSPLGHQISEIEITAAKKSMMGSNKIDKILQLPGKTIKFGEKWNDKLVDSTKASPQNPMSANVTTDMEYTLVGKESKDGIEYLKIAYTGALSINGKGNMQGMDLFMEGTGKTEGFTYFDPKTSMIVYTESNTEMDMSIAISGQQNMTMPMTQSMKTITKIEEKK